ncbi:MAG: DUF4342 domain-containing protein [Atopobiaceae bacterium]|nr:DUF4342 domain-containing protein [Atopobiaceae bacterium]
MENLEKVELVRKKCGVSYEEARKALEACGYEVLDAIIMLEREGKTAQEPEVVVEVAEAREEPKAEERSGYQESKATNAWNQFCKRCREFVNSGMDTTFVAERNGERVIALPVLVVIIGLFMWGASLWLLIIGMFFGFRYSLEGKGKLVNDLNDVMGKAADAADDIKESVA